MNFLPHFFKKLYVCFLIFLFNCFHLTSFAEASSILGYWQTTDDKTNQPEAVIHITENNKKFFGEIVKLYQNSEAKCAACSGDQHNQPLMGMTVLSGFVFKQDKWHDGEILSVKKGAVYPAVISLSSDNNQLNLKVKVGFVTRVQTWSRVSAP